MEISLIIFWVVLIGLGLYVVATYNGLVRLKHDVSRAWSNIDVLMKQRHDELPKLVETCKQYMQYEKDVLERVVKARASVAEARMAGDMGALGAAETEMRIGLGNLFAVAENYPELKANEAFQHLHRDDLGHFRTQLLSGIRLKEIDCQRLGLFHGFQE